MIPHFPRFHGYVHVRRLHGNGYAARSRDREYVDVSFGVESDGGEGSPLCNQGLVLNVRDAKGSKQETIRRWGDDGLTECR